MAEDVKQDETKMVAQLDQLSIKGGDENMWGYMRRYDDMAVVKYVRMLTLILDPDPDLGSWSWILILDPDALNSCQVGGMEVTLKLVDKPNLHP